MRNPIDAAMANPQGALRFLLDGPLHPGGLEATEDLLDRADVGERTRLFDIGCGAGEAVALASRRGADAVGLDRQPDAGRAIRGDIAHLPVCDDSVDVVLAECAICLSPDLDRSIAEARRVLGDGGRLALSDVVVDGDVPDLPDTVAETLCLTGSRDRSDLLARVENGGFTVGDVRDHREKLLAMRDRLSGTVDYEGLLGALGGRGQRLLDGIEDLEDAVEDGRVGYVSFVGTAEG